MCFFIDDESFTVGTRGMINQEIAESIHTALSASRKTLTFDNLTLIFGSAQGSARDSHENRGSLSSFY